ncbi:hypothetical protein ABPG72_019956 [Tetrahymena utriculariae]
MVFVKEIDNKTRFIVIYQDATQTATLISNILNISLSTIYNWIKRIKSDEDIFEVQKGRGRPKKLTQEQEDEILNQVAEKPNKSIVRRIGAQVGVSKSVVHQVLTKNELEFKSIENLIIRCYHAPHL